MSTPEVLDVKTRIFSIAEEVGAIGLVDDLRDAHEESYWHSLRVAITAHEIAGFLGKDRGFADIVGVSGLLHDVGKADAEIAELIAQDRKLTREEKSLVDRHGYIGMRYIQKLLVVSGATNNSEIVLPAMCVANNHHDDLAFFGSDTGKKSAIATFCVQTADRIDARYDPARRRFTKREIKPEDDLIYGSFIAENLLNPSERNVVEPTGERFLEAPRFGGLSLRNILAYAHENWRSIYDPTQQLAVTA